MNTSACRLRPSAAASSAERTKPLSRETTVPAAITALLASTARSVASAEASDAGAVALAGAGGAGAVGGAGGTGAGARSSSGGVGRVGGTPAR
ncbi:hypothetical protein GCM10023340_01030 [Nocardioides marinquilinus]|uniref:Uncharacterized protein n=1 Tax=Nocardioides marinquilinus TaxID=1210400 RepID=A0ABP9P4D3_9ACTN